jgi:D-glycero-D-manno-heptose 1,7-bisphosphate phosphatase
VRGFVLLDRDGTVNREVNYLSDPDEVELYPGTGPGLQRLQERGFGLIIVTNQSGLNRGIFDAATLLAVHERLVALLAEFGVEVAAIYVCPHRPEEGCSCRKPKPGLVEQAVADFGFDPRAAYVVGDKPCDIDLGHNIGATTFLVRTGYGSLFADAPDLRPHHIVDDLNHAADVILGLQAGSRKDDV